MSIVETHPAKPVLSRSELAEFLGVSIAHLAAQDAAGRLPRGARIGRRRVFLRSEIEAWLAAGAPSATRWEAIKSAK